MKSLWVFDCGLDKKQFEEVTLGKRDEHFVHVLQTKY